MSIDAETVMLRIRASWHLMASVGLGTGVLLAEGIGGRLISLPLIKQADIVQVWFSGRADFGSEEEGSADTVHSRTAKWDSRRPGECTIKESQITIRRNGTLRFAAKVKSKDDGDHYCVVIDLLDRRQLRVWRSPKICTAFELKETFRTWVNSSTTFPKAHYRVIESATREDYC
jgi:hypothetical protein